MKLKEARKARGFSQEGIARMVGVSLRHYQMIESATTYPTVPIALDICRILYVSPFEIEEWQTNKK